MLSDIERKYGTPRELVMTFPMNPKEFQILESSMRDGRDSDVTMFIFKGDKIIVIAKPFYPEGLYRAPSGGIRPEENLEQTAKREAYEETGTEIELEKYILKIRVSFVCDREKAEWTSHIFTARYISGELKPIDTHEIEKVALMSLDEISSLKPRLLQQNSGGLAYRAALTEATITEILSIKKGA